mmetsp:Transcript_62580/g.116391  ORF Transcript_62580/g.116391 Transcript_62580/m.116391 type:complete len:219 (+) Transcript_62580:62-718(+)
MVEDTFLRWIKERPQALQAELQRGIREVRAESAQLAALRNELANLQEVRVENARLEAEGQILHGALAVSADGVSARAASLMRIGDQLETALRESEQEVLRLEKVLAEQRKQAEVEASEIDSFLSTYSERLGLSLTRVAPKTVRVRFTLIDKERPDREYCFNLSVADEESASRPRYAVSACQPPVERLADLLATLNRDAGSAAGFSAFMCGMRRAFQSV